MDAMVATMQEFALKGIPVGLFEECPWRDGRYHYMPYRGPGHLQMQTELREKGGARCYFNTGSEQVSFTVSDCPEYGVLVLTNFEAIDNG